MDNLSEMKSSIDNDTEAVAAEELQEIHLKDIYIGDQIGGGGFAIVYEGEWGGKSVALKTLFDPRVDKRLRDEYNNELEVMSKLCHKNIVKIYGACVKAPKLCMVMELCTMSIFNLLHNTTEEITEKTIVRLLLECAEGLEYLHNRKPSIIHRDVKTQNILVTNDLKVKLCDFGLVNTTATTAGTPAYMAPELLADSMYSKKVDVYAFAVVVWECISRSIPFQSWDPRDIREFVTRGERLKIPFSGCPKVCGKLIERCWDHDQEKRPEFTNIVRALSRIYSSMREVSFTEEVHESCGGDSFDALKVQFQSSSIRASRKK